MPISHESPTLTGERRHGILRHWRWAYRKARSFEVGALSAIWRATRFALLGDSGRFYTNCRGWTRLRHSRD